MANLLETAPERFIICAFSLGGIIALQAVIASPERMITMILTSAIGRADSVENAIERRAQVEQARHESSVAVICGMLWLI